MVPGLCATFDAETSLDKLGFLEPRNLSLVHLVSEFAYRRGMGGGSGRMLRNMGELTFSLVGWMMSDVSPICCDRGVYILLWI